MSDPNSPSRGVAKTVVENAITGPPSDPWGQPASSGAQPTGADAWGQPTNGGAAPSGGNQWGGAPAGGAQAGNQWGGGGAAGGGGNQWGGGGAAGGGGNQWSPGAGAAQPQKKGGKGCIISIAAGVLLIGGCIGALAFIGSKAGDAEIDSVEIVESYMAEAYVHVTYEFVEAPEDADALRDVELRLKGDAMYDELTFDWTYLANNDQDPTTTPDSDPPIGTPIDIWIPIEPSLMDTVTLSEGDEPDLVVRLFWGGSRQARERISMGLLYGGVGSPAPQVPVPPPAGAGMPAGGGYVPPAGAAGTPAQLNQAGGGGKP